MRMIDADKLRHELIMGHDLVGAKYVDMTETVKAIPIEWINRWLDASRTNGLSIDVDTMLHDWEVMEGRK